MGCSDCNQKNRNDHCQHRKGNPQQRHETECPSQRKPHTGKRDENVAQLTEQAKKDHGNQ